jgi:hypothetical protein
MQAMVGQVLQAALPVLASLEQAAAQEVAMVEALLKAERVARAAAAMAAAQMETQEQPGQLTRAAVAAQVGINHLRITRAKQAARALSSSKCHRLPMLHSQAA